MLVHLGSRLRGNDVLKGVAEVGFTIFLANSSTSFPRRREPKVASTPAALNP